MSSDRRCPACGRTTAPELRFCGHCGSPLDAASAETMTSPAPIAPPRTPGAADGARFLPGHVLAGRYRMVGLLGRGGMGEVYRADDLKLGQPVALKFLPRDVERDPDRLDRFLTEVRLSLRVTHPNVCRVFDIGEIDGRRFLSMEYVDGEDLASLLRRIGRLPEDKATEIARQLCAGLAAAHDEGVLHRDLKPANVMIDGRGRAKITDFGLAGATVGIAGHDAQAGTPQYMAPEQFEGRELSVQTDLYSLGLVLYELFTGKRAFDSRDLAELAAMRTSTPTSPGAHVSGLDPAVERAILRCVDPDPARRPRSASSLAAALPGGDPLAMAVAAGETPSPEMVARAGGRGELRPLVAVLCLAAVLVGQGLLWWSQGRTGLVNRILMPKPPEELRVAARAALAAAGYTDTPAWRLHGFQLDGEYFEQVARDDTSPDRWADLGSVAPAPVFFWYRESPRAMPPFGLIREPGSANPPVNQPGMARVRLNPSGELQELVVVPPDLPENAGPWAEPDWAPLFAAAGFTVDEWTAAEPEWAPPLASDVRRAWTRGDLRLEAAAFRGRPVWFRVVPPWRRAGDARPVTPTTAERLQSFLQPALTVLVIGIGALLARRNLRQGRSDRRGAFRLAAAFVAFGAVYEVIRLSGDASAWYALVSNNLALQLYDGVLVWLFYVAIEPYVRRLWPDTLIAWTRALEGRFRDPLVGRHILIGAVCGMAFEASFAAPALIGSLAGEPPGPPEGNPALLAGTGRQIAQYFFVMQDSLLIPVVMLLVVLVFRVLFRRPWLAYAALSAVVPGLVLAVGEPWPVAAGRLITVLLVILVLTRLGLLAFLVGIVFSYWDGFNLTTDPSSWFFPSTVMTMLLFTAVAVYAFVVSLGGHALFKDPVLEGRGR